MGLNECQVIPVIAVSDIGRAREFYEDRLGLTDREEHEGGGVRYRCGGDSALHVYLSPENAGKSTATLAGFRVADIEVTVDELTANGVSFEHYETDPIRTDERGIATLGEVRTAWFKDPDGNVLGLAEE